MSTPSANTDRKHCRALYWNALDLLHQPPSGLHDTALVQNIANTDRCDNVADLSRLREHLRNKMPAATYDKIVSVQELTEQDHLRAEIAVDCNLVHTRLSLLRALPPHYRLYYYIAYRPGECSQWLVAQQQHGWEVGQRGEVAGSCMAERVRI